MLDMKKLQGMQKKLDDHIFSVREVDKKNFYRSKVIALKIEMSELFNELGFFKDWKKSHEINRERVLEECADCMSFFFVLANWKDITLELDYSYISMPLGMDKKTVVLDISYDLLSEDIDVEEDLDFLLRIMHLYNFTYEEMEQAYIKKNEENFRRMREGY